MMVSDEMDKSTFKTTPRNSREKRKGRKKFANAETSGRTASGSKQKRSNQSRAGDENLAEKLIVVGLVAACVLAGGIFAVIISSKEDSQAISCGVVTDSEIYKKPSSPFDVNNCNAESCALDVRDCTSICPMGYNSDEDNCPIDCTCSSKGVFEGDVQFDGDSLPHLIESYEYVDPFDTAFDLREVSRDSESYLWPVRSNRKVRVPYFVHEGLASNIRDVMASVSEFLSRRTCIDLYSIDDSQKLNIFHLNLTPGKGCKSTIGYQGSVNLHKKSQDLILGENCLKFEIILHGVLHALGLFHEHTRPDRDSYIEVLWGNVLLVKKQNFQKRSASLEYEDNYEYDLTSLLHYTSDLYTTRGDLSSFVDVLNRKPQTIRSITASETDLAKINDLYRCEKNNDTGHWTEWGEWTICDRTCGYGAKFRWRKCLSQVGEYTSSCIGLKYERLICGTDRCPGEFSLWGMWGKCSETCGNTGVKKRERGCTVQGGCDENVWAYVESTECNREKCGYEPSIQLTYSWSRWGNWENCQSYSCKEFMKRNRSCVDSIYIVSVQCKQDDKEFEYIKNGELEGTEIQSVPCCNVVPPGSEDYSEK